MENKGRQKGYKRSTYLVYRDFQIRFILKFFLLLIAGGIVTIGVLYALARESTTVAIVNSRVVVRSTGDFILPVLVQTVVVVFIMVSTAAAAVMLFVSHKVLGPLHRFKKILESIAEGDFSRNFAIRHGDQLHDVTGALNTVITRLQKELKELKRGIASVKDGLKGISEQDVPEQKRGQLKEVKKTAEELDAISQRFKT